MTKESRMPKESPGLRTVNEPPDWRDDAACRDTDPDLFFPVGTTGPAASQIDEAKQICRGCPARMPCLAWALDHAVSSGVWGGATEEERRDLRGNLLRRAGRRGRTA